MKLFKLHTHKKCFSPIKLGSRFSATSSVRNGGGGVLETRSQPSPVISSNFVKATIYAAVICMRKWLSYCSVLYKIAGMRLQHGQLDPVLSLEQNENSVEGYTARKLPSRFIGSKIRELPHYVLKCHSLC
jgi:hypothetical protein